MCIGASTDRCWDIKVYVEVIWSRFPMLDHLLPPLGFIPNFRLFRWFLLPGGLEFYFLREQLPRLLEHFATLPVDKTEIGFIDITAKMLVFWAILVEEIARLQVVVMKEELHFHSNTTQSLLFTLSEKRRNLTLTSFWKHVCFLRGSKYGEINSWLALQLHINLSPLDN